MINNELENLAYSILSTNNIKGSISFINIGEDAKTFKVKTDSLIIILKIVFNNHFAEIEKERLAYNIVKSVGIPIPGIVKFGQYKEVKYKLEKFIEGTHLLYNSIKTDKSKVYNLVAQELLKLRKIQLNNLVIIEAYKMFENYLEYNVNQLKQLDDPLIKLGCISHSQQNKIYNGILHLKSFNFCFNYSHGDLSYTNIIQNNETKITLIDWGNFSLNIYPFHEIRKLFWQIILNPKRDISELKGLCGGFGEIYLFNKNQELFTFLTLLYAIDKIRWAIDKNKEVVNEKKEELILILKYFNI